MMNLNDIKGTIEINGEFYNPKDVFKSLIEQGIKIHPLNGSLLIGRTFVDPSSNLTHNIHQPCPFINNCKIYDKLNINMNLQHSNNSFSSALKDDFNSFNNLSNSSQSPPSNKSYVDPIQLNNDDIDIRDLFTESFEYDNLPQSNADINESLFNSTLQKNGDNTPEMMMGISSVTKYGNKSKINPLNIPSENQGRCPNCQSIINIRWIYCGNCGSIIK